MKQRAGWFGLMALASLSVSAPASDFDLDPATRFQHVLDQGETFVDLLLGDFNGDGRADLAALTSADRVVVMISVAERQHHRIVQLDSGGDSSLVVTGIAVQRLGGTAGPDRLLLETDGGLVVGTIDDEGTFDGDVVSGTDTHTGGRVLFDELGDGPHAVAWRVGPGGTWLQPVAFERGSGDHWMTGLHYPIPSGSGAHTVVDLVGSGYAQVAATGQGGLVVVDVTGQVPLVEGRSSGEINPNLDRLARLRNIDGAERLAWYDPSLPKEVRLVDLSVVDSAELGLDVDPPTRMAGADVNGDGLADLVLLTTGNAGLDLEPKLRILPAGSGSEPFDIESEQPVAVLGSPDAELDSEFDGETPVAIVFGDLDRDGDTDFAVVSQTRLFLARSDQIHHDDLIASVQPSPVAQGPSQAFLTGANTTLNLRFLEPVAWVSIAGEIASLDYRIVARPDADVLEVVETEHTGSIALNSTWPSALDLPVTSLTPEQEADSVWYIQYELVRTNGNKLPSGLILVAPVPSQLDDLCDECNPGGRLWFSTLEGPDGGVTGVEGIGPIIPRMPPPRPVPPPSPPPGGGS